MFVTATVKNNCKPGLARRELEALIEAGLTQAEMAKALGRCRMTVQRWLARYGLRTQAAQRIAEQRQARATGLATAELVCAKHGRTRCVIDGEGVYRCRRCRVESVTRRRRRVKQTLAAEAGGSCFVCGYDRYAGALEFHHVDPSTKRATIGGLGGRAIARARLEARNCVLLCSNCHAEVEAGLVVLRVK
jgi:transposase